MKYDVVTFGETMLRLSPASFETIEQTHALDMHVGGSESNTAVGLARLGRRVAWLSRLTDNPIGRYIRNSIRAQGVDTSHVVWTKGDRIGTYFMENGAPPRQSQVYYDRAGSAASKFEAGELPPGLFEPGATRIFHTTGITLGIGPAAATTAVQAAQRAKSAGALVSFDTNYRARLWSAQAAAVACAEFIHLSDLLLIPSRDAATLFSCDSRKPTETLARLADRFPHVTIVLTCGSQGAVAKAPGQPAVEQSAFETTTVERLGSGDAFSAGFLAAYLQDAANLAGALRWGNAAAAVKHTLPGDLPLLDPRLVTQIAQGHGSKSILR